MGLDRIKAVAEKAGAIVLGGMIGASAATTLFGDDAVSDAVDAFKQAVDEPQTVPAQVIDSITVSERADDGSAVQDAASKSLDDRARVDAKLDRPGYVSQYG